MKAVWTALALLAALLVESALSQVVPRHARDLDPFLLVLVYCGLSGGEVHGMLAGAAAGLVQDVHFGGPVVGLSGLSKLMVGFGVGAAASRFLLSGPLPRLCVLFAAVVVDTLLVGRLAAVFDIPAAALTVSELLGRGAVNALVGAVLYEVVDRRRAREARL